MEKGGEAKVVYQNESSISVIGLGYVGLTTALCLASRGFKAVGVDTNAAILKQLQEGKPHFYEPGLKPLLDEARKNGSIRFTGEYTTALESSTTAFIAVGTPSSPDGGHDLSHVEGAAAALGRALRKVNAYRLIVVKSTVLPGTTLGVVKPLIERFSGKRLGEYGLCNNPEFIREGSAVEDTLNPDRVVIGESSWRFGRPWRSRAA